MQVYAMRHGSFWVAELLSIIPQLYGLFVVLRASICYKYRASMPCGLLPDFSLFHEGPEGFLAGLGMTGGWSGG